MAPSGRSSNRARRPRRPETTAQRRFERVRGGAAQRTNKRPGGRGAARSRPKAHTGGAFKLASTRRAAMLAILVCAMALSVSVPLRTYISQRTELAGQQQRETALVNQVDRLKQREKELSDPAHVEAEARSRLGYVRPGETPYIVEVPPESRTAVPKPPPATKDQNKDMPWYERAWKSLMGEDS